MNGLPLVDVIIVSIVGFFEVIFSLYLLLEYQKTSAIISFSILSFCVGGWCLVYGLPLFLNRESFLFDFFARLSFTFASILFPFLYLFVIQFPYPKKVIYPYKWLLLFVPPFLLQVFIFFSDRLVIGFRNNPTGGTIYGDMYWIYAFYIFFMFSLIISSIIIKRRFLSGPDLRLINILFVGVLTSGLVGIISQLVLPYFFQILPPFYSIGPSSSIIWLAMMGLILRRSKYAGL